MAQPQRQAQFFCRPDGIVLPKAPPLKVAERRKIYARDGGVCQHCRKPVKFGGIHCDPFMKIASGQIDHVFPRSRGGQNTDDNLRLLCLTCNSQKGAK